MKKNEVSLYQKAMEKASINVANFESAINEHMGGTAIRTAVDSQGNEYVTAKFQLLSPVKNRTEMTVNDIELATQIEKMRKMVSMGELASFGLCRILADMADSDMASLNFASVSEMAQAVLGIAKSTLQNYRRIGQYFVAEDGAHLRGAIPQETSISLLNQLLSYVTTETEDGKPDIANVEKLFTTGIITPYMKQKDYKRILTVIKDIPSDKQLKELTEEEIEALKANIKEASTPKKVEKQDEKQDEKQLTEPQEIVGIAMGMLKKLTDNFNALSLAEDRAQVVNTAIENLQSILDDIINETM